MKILYVDGSCGASGDMMLGALIDAGASLDALNQTIDQLRLPGVALQARQVRSHGLGATQAIVSIAEDHHRHRHLNHILAIIEEAALDPWITQTSVAVFRRLAEAESKVHGIPIEEVHFHEIGALDTLVDIVGTVAAIAMLRPDRIHCSALNTGSGTVHCAHGWLPVPAPATAELIRGFPAYGSDIPFELLTPTGAALLTTIADEFGPLPAMRIDCIGYGAGTHDIGRPNLLRLFVGDNIQHTDILLPDISGLETDRVGVIETQIDDMTPECLASAMENLLSAGAIDAMVVPVQMKKGRTGFWMQVLVEPSDLSRIARFLLQETTTFGIRWRLESRIKLSREIQACETPYGPVRMKIGRMEGKPVQVSPEYEDCRLAAQRHGIPVHRILNEARATFHLTSEFHDVERKDENSQDSYRITDAKHS